MVTNPPLQARKACNKESFSCTSQLSTVEAERITNVSLRSALGAVYRNHREIGEDNGNYGLGL